MSDCRAPKLAGGGERFDALSVVSHGRMLYSGGNLRAGVGAGKLGYGLGDNTRVCWGGKGVGGG